VKRYDRCYAQVDLGAIRHNITEARKKIKDTTKIMAIVKADAYGHGAVPVAKSLLDLVDAYGVATLEEAVELRKNKIDKMILILGYTPEGDYEDLILHDISQAVYTEEMAQKLSDMAVKLGKKAKVHIKIDTGMGRIGFPPTEKTADLIAEIKKFPGIELEGMFTHFARADETTTEPVKEPLKKYMHMVEMLSERGIEIPVKHVSNSASIMRIPEANLDMVRSGITTYGLYPSEEVDKKEMDLIPAMQWKAHISFVKDVEPGSSISYGGTFTAQKKMRVATVPVGYADGFKRDLSNRGASVLVHGKRAAILGRICMDQFMIDVTEIDGVQIGDEVTLFGRDGDAFIPVEEIADASHSFNYEYVCGISPRVPRKYI
jgi:alanine racemase